MNRTSKKRPAAEIYAELLSIAAWFRDNYYSQHAIAIERAVDELKRRPATRRAPITSVNVTPKLAAEIKRIARDNPTMSQHRITAIVGVNPGRVSEVLAGKRGVR